MAKRNIPAPCPSCKVLLQTIIPEESGTAITYNEEEGKYESDNAQTQITYKCGECGAKIGGWRADGEHWGIIPEFEE